MWIIKRITNYFLEFVFPTRCELCGNKNNTICDTCIETFIRAVDTTSPSTYSHFSYKDARVRSLLQKIKYFRKLYLIEPLVHKVASDYFLREFLADTSTSILLSIPMTRSRIWKRGGNHTIYIAKAFSTELSVTLHTKFLIRKKDTKQQVHTHSKKERLSNIKNAFTVDEKYLSEVRGKNIILIDDVTTTGATIQEAINVLRKHGFKNIKAITLAH